MGKEWGLEKGRGVGRGVGGARKQGASGETHVEL